MLTQAGFSALRTKVMDVDGSFSGTKNNEEIRELKFLECASDDENEEDSVTRRWGTRRLAAAVAAT